MSTITVRYAHDAEAELIAELSRQTFDATFAGQNTRENMDRFMREQFAAEKLVAEVTAPGNTFLLAFEKELPVGYARLLEGKNPPELGQEPALEIARIYAVSSSVGKGEGAP